MPIRRLWPAGLAVALAAPRLSGGGSDEEVVALAGDLPLLPLLYLVVAKFRWRRATWAVRAVLLGAFADLRSLDVVVAAAVLVILVRDAAGRPRSRLRRRA
ncbi:hypothetical protein [Actinomadura rugatobispora]|uniref:Uncharacterized protein n=1 Tax=Actinomadura rugatobispora TaxID=1994 RepID=A0ABW1AAE7_9ACTN|nr:hypothetical protein GCM10010200_082040 [Actinomadura rugatobispora]